MQKTFFNIINFYFSSEILSRVSYIFLAMSIPFIILVIFRSKIHEALFNFLTKFHIFNKTLSVFIFTEKSSLFIVYALIVEIIGMLMKEIFLVKLTFLVLIYAIFRAILALDTRKLPRFIFPVFLALISFQLFSSVSVISKFSVKIFDKNISVYEFLKNCIAVVFFYYIHDTVLKLGRRYIFRSQVFSENTKVVYYRLFYYTEFLIFIIISLNLLGIELKSITMIISALGIGVGFGLQKIVSNFISGLIIMGEKGFKINDIIVLPDGSWARVKHIGIRSTTVRLYTGEAVVIPNDNITMDVIKNISTHNALRIEIRFTVDYSADLQKVEKIALSAAKEVYGVSSKNEYKPLCIIDSVDMNGAVLRLFFWTNDVDKTGIMSLKSAIIKKIIKDFKASEISFSIPKLSITKT